MITHDCSQRSIQTGIILLLSLSLLACSETSQSSVEFDYLSDVFNERGVYYNIQSGQGELGWDTTYKAYWGGVPKPLRIVDKTYEKGLGTHADSEIVLNLDGQYQRFAAEVGIAYQNGHDYGSAVARVIVDGKVCFETPFMNAHTRPIKVDVDVVGAKELRLIGDKYNENNHNDAVCWADGKLFYNPKMYSEKKYLEVGAFARVISCDPKMKDGPKVDRIKPISREVLTMDRYLFSDDEDNYEATVWEDGLCCIGLRWHETRMIRQMAIEFADGSPVPDSHTAKIQWWVGDSPWQGQWRDLDGQIKADGRIWLFDVSPKNIQDARNRQREGNSARMGAEKIRWIFGKADQPIRVKRLSAWTHSLAGEAEIELSLDLASYGKVGKVVMYNGTLINENGQEATSRRWELDKPLKLKVLYKNNGFYLADNTSVRVEIDDKVVSIGIEDILKRGPVYVEQYGLFAAAADCSTSLAEYKKKIIENTRIVDRIRKMEDQSFDQAWKQVHRSVQDGSPMLISLACNNKKYVVSQEGKIWKDHRVDSDKDGVVTITPVFGSNNKGVARELYARWLPIPIVSKAENGVRYTQRTCVAPFDDKAPEDSPWWYRNNSLCVSEITIENTEAISREASVELLIMADQKSKIHSDLTIQQDGDIIAEKDSKVLVVAKGSSLVFLKTNVRDGIIKISGTLPGHMKESIVLYMPSWEVQIADYQNILSKCDLFEKTECYWKKLVANAMQIDIPEPMLLDIIRASQVHCFLAARENQFGNLIAPWISSDRYGPLESESQAVIIGMDMMGQEEFARRSHDFFLKKYSPEGYLTTGYTLMGTGQHLMMLGKHYQLNQNEEWMKQAQPIMAKACEWILEQIDKNKNLYANGEKPYDYGLFPPGVYADWNRFAYHSYMAAFFYGGLKETTDALRRADDSRADDMTAKTKQFRDDFIRAYKWTEERYPVLRQPNGTWGPGSPSMIGCFGLIGDIYRGEDGNRAWAKDGDKIFALTYAGMIDPEQERVSILRNANYLEEVGFLSEGMGQYTAKESQENWFNIGGFGKLQPYYTRLPETYAAMDEVKLFIRSYFNPIGSLVDQEILTFWEHFMRSGGWNKTHETGWFLEQTRLMLLMERDNDLWIGPFVTTHWMKDGMTVGVRQAPSEFGRVDYKITSHAHEGYLEAEITPPTRNKPNSIVLRLRHPNEKKIKGVTVNGQAYNNYDPDKDIVTLTSWTDKIVVRAEY